MGTLSYSSRTLALWYTGYFSMLFGTFWLFNSTCDKFVRKAAVELPASIQKKNKDTSHAEGGKSQDTDIRFVQSDNY